MNKPAKCSTLAMKGSPNIGGMVLQGSFATTGRAAWLVRRFRKLLVSYEKLERSFIALNHLAAAIIAYRKVPLAVNMVRNRLDS